MHDFGTARGWVIASRPQFVIAYVIFFFGGIVFGKVQGFDPSPDRIIGSIMVMVIAALAVHYRDESADWSAGYDREHGGAGVVRSGLLSAGALSRVGAVLAACAIGLIALLCYYEPWAAIAGVPGIVMILFHNGLTERISMGHELVTALSYWSAVTWAYSTQGWQVTRAFALFSLFSYLVALAFVPYQDIGDYEYDRRSGKKTLTVRLGPDKIGILSIMIGLAAILVLYGALLTLN